MLKKSGRNLIRKYGLFLSSIMLASVLCDLQSVGIWWQRISYVGCIIHAREKFRPGIHCQSFLKEITHRDYVGFQKAFFHKNSTHNKEILNSEGLVFSSCKSHWTLLQASTDLASHKSKQFSHLRKDNYPHDTS